MFRTWQAPQAPLKINSNNSKEQSEKLSGIQRIQRIQPTSIQSTVIALVTNDSADREKSIVEGTLATLACFQVTLIAGPKETEGGIGGKMCFIWLWRIRHCISGQLKVTNTIGLLLSRSVSTFGTGTGEKRSEGGFWCRCGAKCMNCSTFVESAGLACSGIKQQVCDTKNRPGTARSGLTWHTHHPENPGLE